MISRRAGILTSDTSVSGGDIIASHEVGAAAGGQRTGVRITVGLAVGVGSPGSEPLVDGELGPIIGDDVVVESRERRRAQGGRDVISRRAGILPGDARVVGCDIVGSHEVRATAGGQRTGVRITVGLAVRVGGPGSEPLVDGDLAPSLVMM